MYCEWDGEVTHKCVIVFAEVESFLTVTIQLIGIIWGNSKPIYLNASVECSLLGAQCAYKACERLAETRLCGVQSFRTSAYWIVNGWMSVEHRSHVSHTVPGSVDIRVLHYVGMAQKWRWIQVFVLLDLWIILCVLLIFLGMHACIRVCIHLCVSSVQAYRSQLGGRGWGWTCRMLVRFKSK